MKFENMDIWQKAVQLSIEIYKNNRKIKDYGFKDQIGRSALSIPSNIAEGLERTSIKESLNFLSYAKASCGELFTQIVIGENVGYLAEHDAFKFKTEVKTLSRMIGGLISKRKTFLRN